MARTHNVGFPRIGSERQLKFAIESYWNGGIDETTLLATAGELRREHWRRQQRAGLDMVPVGDFSLYDHILDLSLALGNIPDRFIGDPEAGNPVSKVELAFRIARGYQDHSAGEMTKWFDTNYHYIVPEFTGSTRFTPDAEHLGAQVEEVAALGIAGKLVLPGPLTYLYLGKSKERGLDRLALLPELVDAYCRLVRAVAARSGGAPLWVQLDEPILALDLPEEWRKAFPTAYRNLHEGLRDAAVHTLLAVYFGGLRDNLDVVRDLPVDGLHVDLVRGAEDLPRLSELWPRDRVLSLGVIDGRNVWRADLTAILDRVEPLHRDRGDNLWIGPSCSLLHVPVDLERETKLHGDVRPWLAFAVQKLQELRILGIALNQGRDAVERELAENRAIHEERRTSSLTVDAAVQSRLAAVDEGMLQRSSPYRERAPRQAARFNLPVLPTTTIGSFPQTGEIRATRRRYKAGRIDRQEYESFIRSQIDQVVAEQETCGLDVLVHGEAERNDMVEYFGEQLAGYAFTNGGWVQSYGTRCVKPPIIYGDVSRPAPMTVKWITYAQARTKRPMKGMLTGPITMMQWAFVRDDQPREITARQIALALRDEVLDLESAGIGIIQVDEAALREALPLRREDRPAWLRHATENFRLTTSGVADETQVHTHMCYSEFTEILGSIVDLDADVITIEAARSGMELLDAFETFEYPNEIGPGVYDIHSPAVPSVEFIRQRLRDALQRIPAERLWVNPDCGLKTRRWEEVTPALRNLVTAARELRRGVAPGETEK